MTIWLIIISLNSAQHLYTLGKCWAVLSFYSAPPWINLSFYGAVIQIIACGSLQHTFTGVTSIHHCPAIRLSKKQCGPQP
ncbi:hypothetical protein CLU79DRAFT_780282 [Phycomyces nitens]|nr:hypothetical protein CLU79DRAFT_780282 [Phycomyces nitens]